MKFKHLLLTGMVTALGLGLLPARTWTSADGAKTFEGEFKTYDADGQKVTVIMRSGKSVTFAIGKLSEADRTFVEEQHKAANGPTVLDALKEQKIGAGLMKKGILQKLSGEKYEDFELTKAPEYYLVYFGASW